MALSALYVTEFKANARTLYANPEALLTSPPHVITANAIQANQATGTIQQRLQESPLDYLDVVWGVDAGDVQDCSDDCQLVGTPSDGATKRIDLPLCKEIDLQVSTEDLRRQGVSKDNLEEAAKAEISRQLAVKSAKLDTWVNTQGLVVMKALHNTPKAGTAATLGTVGSDGVITVPAANYTRKMVAELAKLARLNQMGTPWMDDAGKLFVDFFNAGLDSTNLNGQGDAARIKLFREYYDLEGFPDAGISEDTFLVKPGALGLFYKSFLPNTPEVKPNAQIWTNFRSNNITDMVYDLVYQETCTMVNSHPVTIYKAKLKAHIGIHTAAGVDATRPGILLLKAGA